MTLLEATESEGRSYLELAEIIQDRGIPGVIDSDLEQLFHRVVFNIMVGKVKCCQYLEIRSKSANTGTHRLCHCG